MASPDVTQYVDLTIFDRDVQSLYDAAVAQLQVELPDWVPREGNTEVLTLSALSLLVAESVFALNRLPGSITEILLKLFDVVRDIGAQPVANLTFTMANNAGYTVPAGVRSRINLPGGIEPVIFTTTIDLVIPNGSTSGTVSAVGDQYTDAANNTIPGTLLDYLESTLYVDSVSLAAITTSGRGQETDNDYFTRGLAQFQRLTSTLAIPSQFVSFVLENPVVHRAFVIDNFNAPGGTPGSDGGHVTVVVYGNGALLSGGDKTALLNSMTPLALSNLAIHVTDPTVTNINVTATVHAVAGFDHTTVQNSVIAALQAYLNPNSWDWSGTVRRNELIALMSNVEGVDYVTSITTPASDVSLSGNGTLANAGTLTITVT